MHDVIYWIGAIMVGWYALGLVLVVLILAVEALMSLHARFMALLKSPPVDATAADAAMNQISA